MHFTGTKIPFMVNLTGPEVDVFLCADALHWLSLGSNLRAKADGNKWGGGKLPLTPIHAHH